MTNGDLVENGMETLSFECYANDVDGETGPVPDIDDVMPEEGDTYLNAEVNLPRGEASMTGIVHRRKRTRCRWTAARSCE